MKYRQLGRTGLFVSEICLGTMTFGGEGWWKAMGALEQTEVTKLIARSFESGVNFIDTADVYAYGQSETLVGAALADLKIERDQLVVATKVRSRVGPGVNQVGLSRGHIIEGCKASLKRLKLDYIDLYQVHGADPVTPIEETVAALDTLVSQGYVRYVGCSNMMAWQIMKAIGIADKTNAARFETLQAYYSLAGRDLERETVPMLLDQKMGLLVWSPLAGGFLSGKFTRGKDGPKDARRSTFDFPPIDVEHSYGIIEAMQPIAAAHGVSVARIAIAWLLHQPSVTSVIIGAKRIEQLDDNIAASEITLSAAELASLDEASKLAPEYPGWMLKRQAEDRMPGVPPR
jgi:aryl-alcohol dehydrogenase-like predicted oxidoreductase